MSSPAKSSSPTTPRDEMKHERAPPAVSLNPLAPEFKLGEAPNQSVSALEDENKRLQLAFRRNLSQIVTLQESEDPAHARIQRTTTTILGNDGLMDLILQGRGAEIGGFASILGYTGPRGPEYAKRAVIMNVIIAASLAKPGETNAAGRIAAKYRLDHRTQSLHYVVKAIGVSMPLVEKAISAPSVVERGMGIVFGNPLFKNYIVKTVSCRRLKVDKKLTRKVASVDGIVTRKVARLIGPSRVVDRKHNRTCKAPVAAPAANLHELIAQYEGKANQGTLTALIAVQASLLEDVATNFFGTGPVSAQISRLKLVVLQHEFFRNKKRQAQEAGTYMFDKAACLRYYKACGVTEIPQLMGKDDFGLPTDALPRRPSDFYAYFNSQKLEFTGFNEMSDCGAPFLGFKKGQVFLELVDEHTTLPIGWKYLNDVYSSCMGMVLNGSDIRAKYPSIGVYDIKPKPESMPYAEPLDLDNLSQEAIVSGVFLSVKNRSIVVSPAVSEIPRLLNSVSNRRNKVWKNKHGAIPSGQTKRFYKALGKPVMQLKGFPFVNGSFDHLVRRVTGEEPYNYQPDTSMHLEWGFDKPDDKHIKPGDVYETDLNPLQEIYFHYSDNIYVRTEKLSESKIDPANVVISPSRADYTEIQPRLLELQARRQSAKTMDAVDAVLFETALFCREKRALVSYDGSKMEASADAADIQAMIEAFLDSIGAPLHLRNFMMKAGKWSQGGGLGVLRDRYMKVPYQISGGPFTFEVNDSRSWLACETVHSDSKLNHSDLIAVSGQLGVTLKVERVILLAPPGRPLGPVGVPLGIDMLGSGAISVRLAGGGHVYVPFLETARWAAAMMRTKRSESGAVPSLAKYLSLYISGGWITGRNELLQRLIKVVSHDLTSESISLKSLSHDPVSANLTEEQVVSLVEMVAHDRLTPASAIRLFLPPEARNEQVYVYTPRVPGRQFEKVLNEPHFVKGLEHVLGTPEFFTKAKAAMNRDLKLKNAKTAYEIVTGIPVVKLPTDSRALEFLSKDYQVYSPDRKLLIEAIFTATNLKGTFVTPDARSRALLNQSMTRRNRTEREKGLAVLLTDVGETNLHIAASKFRRDYEGKTLAKITASERKRIATALVAGGMSKTHSLSLVSLLPEGRPDQSYVKLAQRIKKMGKSFLLKEAPKTNVPKKKRTTVITPLGMEHNEKAPRLRKDTKPHRGEAKASKTPKAAPRVTFEDNQERTTETKEPSKESGEIKGDPDLEEFGVGEDGKPILLTREEVKQRVRTMILNIEQNSKTQDALERTSKIVVGDGGETLLVQPKIIKSILKPINISKENPPMKASVVIANGLPLGVSSIKKAGMLRPQYAGPLSVPLGKMKGFLKTILKTLCAQTHSMHKSLKALVTDKNEGDMRHVLSELDLAPCALRAQLVTMALLGGEFNGAIPQQPSYYLKRATVASKATPLVIEDVSREFVLFVRSTTFSALRHANRVISILPAVKGKSTIVSQSADPVPLVYLGGLLSLLRKGETYDGTMRLFVEGGVPVLKPASL